LRSYVYLLRDMAGQCVITQVKLAVSDLRARSDARVIGETLYRPWAFVLAVAQL